MTPQSPGEMVRAAVLAEATRCLNLGPSCCEDAAPGYDLEAVAWCQIFWLKCLRAALLTTKVWGDLARKGWVEAWLPRTREPQMGDLGYIHKPFQHGAVFESVSAGGIVTSIDGNSSGRVVLRRSRPFATFTTFYSIQPLVNEWVPKQYRETTSREPNSS